MRPIDKVNSTDLDKYWISISVFCLLAVITSSLSVNFSKDWPQYLNMFKKARKIPWETHFESFSIFSEVLYVYTSKFFGHLLGFPVFIYTTTVGLLALKLRYFEKILGATFGGLFFYVCLYLFPLEGTALRIGFATALVVPAWYMLKLNKPFYALLLLLLASQIHLTVLIFLLIFPIYYWKASTVIAYVALAVAPFLIIFDISIFSYVIKIAQNINPRYVIYDAPRYMVFDGQKFINQNTTGLFFYFIAFFTIIASLTHYYLKDLIYQDRFLRTMQTLCILGVASMSVFHDHIVVGARLGDLLLLPIVILLSLVLVTFDKKKMVLEKYTLISVFLIFFFARFSYLYPQIGRSLF